MTGVNGTPLRPSGVSHFQICCLFTLACAPYLLNDLAYAWLVANAPAWLFYLADYGFRFISLAILFAIPALRELAWPGEDGRLRWGLTVLLAVAVLAIDHVLGLYLRIPLNNTVVAWHLFDFPRLENPWLHGFDLTAGLALVAVSEELLCRRVAARLLERFNFSALLVALISSAIFAAIHWGQGPGDIAQNFALGLMLMAVYQRWRSLAMVIAIHFLIDFKHFL